MEGSRLSIKYGRKYHLSYPVEATGFRASRGLYIAGGKDKPTRIENESMRFAGIGIPIPAKEGVYHIFNGTA